MALDATHPAREAFETVLARIVKGTGKPATDALRDNIAAHLLTDMGFGNAKDAGRTDIMTLAFEAMAALAAHVIMTLHDATATDATAEPTNDGPKIKADESALAYLTLRDNDAPLSEWGIGPVSEGN